MTNIIWPRTILLQDVFSADIKLVWLSLYTLVPTIRLAVFKFRNAFVSVNEKELFREEILRENEKVRCRI